MALITEKVCIMCPPVASFDIVLPPTPTASDDECEEIPQFSKSRTSLAELIPIASAALQSKQTIQQHQQSPLARAVTKVKLGVQTRRLKEKYLSNEWIRLALNAPVDEAAINGHPAVTRTKTSRTKEIARWYEWKYKNTTLSINELESAVDELRNQKLLRLEQKLQDDLL